MESKKNLRASMTSLLAALDTAYFRAAGLAALEKLAAEAVWREAKELLLFMSMEREIDTSPFLARAFLEGKKVFLPRVEGKAMRFYRIDSPAGPWECGPWGLREPRPDFPFENTRGSALVITPGLAFDTQGNRLGRGGGYYDRFFSFQEGKYFAAGLCLKEQIVSGLPRDGWDRPVDALVTNEGFGLFQNRGFEKNHLAL